MSNNDFLISYATDDREKAEVLRVLLAEGKYYQSDDPNIDVNKVFKRQKKLQGWIDFRGLAYGTRWRVQIQNALMNSSWIICLVGPNYFTRASSVKDIKAPDKTLISTSQKDDDTTERQFSNYPADQLTQQLLEAEDGKNSAHREPTISFAQIREVTRSEFSIAAQENKLIPIIVGRPENDEPIREYLREYHCLYLKNNLEPYSKSVTNEAEKSKKNGLDQSGSASEVADSESVFQVDAKVQITKQTKGPGAIEIVEISTGYDPVIKRYYKFSGNDLVSIRRLRGLLIKSQKDSEDEKIQAEKRVRETKKIRLDNSLLIPALVLAGLLWIPLMMTAVKFFEDSSIGKSVFELFSVDNPDQRKKMVTIPFELISQDFDIEDLARSDPSSFMPGVCENTEAHIWPVHQADQVSGNYDCAAHVSIQELCDFNAETIEVSNGFSELYISLGYERTFERNLLLLCNLDEVCEPYKDDTGKIISWSFNPILSGSNSYPAEVGDEGRICQLKIPEQS